MRRSALLLLLIITFTWIFTISRIRGFIQIFFHHDGIEITQEEIATSYHSATGEPESLVIPKIIHQVYHDWSLPAVAEKKVAVVADGDADREREDEGERIPKDWDKVRHTCIDKHPDWEYKLWTLTTSRAFIAEHYAWFLPTYDSYPYAIQRTDTIRYFLLRHYGGIYLDLDNGCLRDLAPLRALPAFSTDGGRGALSNNIMGGEREHPFWVFLTEGLREFSWNYFLPYPTISYASGQWFETAIWQRYHRHSLTLPSKYPPVYRIMMDDRPGTPPWIFFTQERGGSWRNWDNEWWLLVGEHLWLLSGGIVLLIGAGVGVGWWCWRCCMGCWIGRGGGEKGCRRRRREGGGKVGRD